MSEFTNELRNIADYLERCPQPASLTIIRGSDKSEGTLTPNGKFVFLVVISDEDPKISEPLKKTLRGLIE